MNSNSSTSFSLNQILLNSFSDFNLYLYQLDFSSSIPTSDDCSSLISSRFLSSPPGRAAKGRVLNLYFSNRKKGNNQTNHLNHLLLLDTPLISILLEFLIADLLHRLLSDIYLKGNDIFTPIILDGTYALNARLRSLLDIRCQVGGAHFTLLSKLQYNFGESCLLDNLIDSIFPLYRNDIELDFHHSQIDSTNLNVKVRIIERKFGHASTRDHPLPAFLDRH
ncbi:hypothetical protein LXL04_038707 [Taraxacum kok-saghyz]